MPSAADTEVWGPQEWQKWFAANRSVIEARVGRSGAWMVLIPRQQLEKVIMRSLRHLDAIYDGGRFGDDRA